MLEAVGDENGQSVSEVTFASGTKYMGKFPSSFTFRDMGGDKHVVDADTYIHYADESLSAFSDGMTVNMDEAGKGYLDL